MNKEEAKARIEAAEKVLAAAKAALEQAHEPDGRVIMKPSEVPVGEYFKFVDHEQSHGAIHQRVRTKLVTSSCGLFGSYDLERMGDSPVYLTDPYGNAIEPREWLPYGFAVHKAHTRLNRLRVPFCTYMAHTVRGAHAG